MMGKGKPSKPGWGFSSWHNFVLERLGFGLQRYVSSVRLLWGGMMLGSSLATRGGLEGRGEASELGYVTI